MPSQIERQAPYLRRYARALMGSQSEGDALVRTAIAGLTDGALALPADVPLRVALYRLLHQVWDGDAARGGAAYRFHALSPAHRAALLLAGMEGLSFEDAATVLQVETDAFRHTLTEAQDDLARQQASPVLIIEDEPIIALDLTRLVRELGHEVLGSAATRAEAVALARRHPPRLILADIRLADGSSGIDAANEILAEVSAPVIFITAFPEHLLTGEQPEPAFVITKPFRDEAIKALVAQALSFRLKPPPAADQITIVGAV